ncbi:MAG: branched-chain amino acid ABC transporter permease [Deltaproteobacteria bacterium CG_4_9_14_3_um_filter_44_9]|nr:MAG: branched-chain amino acid ABC transporter permease [Deltaproteobacteria bacterium CG2_30_43_15]PIU84479.1 MAG: branched-chain amino acid ABC transporter permease [Deltaproteobacteria bacterium CG06_land_8_20_14_3_00_44_19]PIX22638.1 MAG: branched-chain amino acid ABC transporter permease [Deltaproteobacteria bacterium CG_4_8_14_3_um_filter_43_13]PIZ19166.1 MAG: branched-chain amino acid ABC transporter permease [Deltaproteobacteria bacterium CG_4_10_14_0_8_um_filter_43_12]PJB40085.1 MAG
MDKKDSLTLLILTVCLVIFPFIVTNTYYISTMVFVGINGIIAIGLSLLMGYAGQISIGHAAFFGLGAYTSAVLTAKLGFHPWGAFFMGILLSSCVALIIGIPSLKLKGHYLAMATLGFGEITYIVFNELTDITGGPSGIGGIPKISLAGYTMNTDIKYYFFVWAFLLLILTLSLNLIHSRIGRALRSIHDSEVAANAMGINTSKLKIQVFMISAVFGSVAGSLYTHYVTFVSPSSFGLFFSILLVMMVVIGGMHSVWGALIGATLLTILPEFLRALKDFEIFVYGAVLLLIMIFLPRGLIGGLEYLFNRLIKKV